MLSKAFAVWRSLLGAGLGSGGWPRGRYFLWLIACLTKRRHIEAMGRASATATVLGWASARHRAAGGATWAPGAACRAAWQRVWRTQPDIVTGQVLAPRRGHTREITGGLLIGWMDLCAEPKREGEAPSVRDTCESLGSERDIMYLIMTELCRSFKAR